MYGNIFNIWQVLKERKQKNKLLVTVSVMMMQVEGLKQERMWIGEQTGIEGYHQQITYSDK